MSFGARFEGEFGQLLIDETLPVFQIVEEGSLVANVISGPSGSFVAGMGATFKRSYARTPLVVIFPPYGVPCWLSGGSITTSGFAVQCNDGFAYSRDHGAIVLPSPVYGARYAVISDEVRPSNEQFGMRLWAADGRLIYDSGYPLAYFRGFGSSMNYHSRFQTRDDNQLEAFIFIHHIPMPDATCGVVLNTLPFSGDTYPTHAAGLRAPNTGYFGWQDGGRTNFGVGVQGPPGFSSGSQSVGDISMYMQSVLFVSR